MHRQSNLILEDMADYNLTENIKSIRELKTQLAHLEYNLCQLMGTTARLILQPLKNDLAKFNIIYQTSKLVAEE